MAVRAKANAAGVGATKPFAGFKTDPAWRATVNPIGIPPVMPAGKTTEQITRGLMPNANPVAPQEPGDAVQQSPLAVLASGPLAGEYGTLDSPFGPGYTFTYYGERYTSDLLSRNKGFLIYELMLRDDQVAASLQIAHSFITSRAWLFEVDDQEVQGEAVEFLQFNLNRALHGTVRQLLEQLLTARIWGFALVEKIFELLPWEGKQWWMLAAYKLRPAWTFTFQHDRHGNVMSAVQQQFAQRLAMPLEKFIHIVHQPEYDPIFGRSALVAVYDRWWEKKNAEKLWDHFLERAATGFLFGTMPQGLSKHDADGLLNAMDRSQAGAAILAPHGTTLGFVHQGDVKAYAERIQNLDQAIARALLLPSHIGLSNQGSTGSKAQGSSQLQTFQNIVDSWSAWVEDALNEQLFGPLVAWNFGPDVPAPLFRFRRVSQEQLYHAVEAINAAILAGTIVRQDEDESLVREKLGMPPRDFEATVDIVPMPGEDAATARDDASHATEVSAEGGEQPDENDPVSGASTKNVLFGVPRVRLSAWSQAQRLDVPGSLLLLTKQDAQLQEHIVAAAGKTFDALAAQVKNKMKPDDVRHLEVPKAVRASAHKALTGALQTTYDNAAKHAELDLRRMGYKGDVPGASKGAPGARIKFLALDETTAADWLEANIDQLLDALTQKQISAFRQALLNGIQSDWSESQIIEAVQTALGGQVDLAWVATAVRTLDASAFNAARRAVFEDDTLDGYVVGYEYTGVLDEFTTILCETLQTADGGDAVRYPVDSPVWDLLMPPNHFNCRSTVIPLTKSDGDIEWSDEALVDGLDPQKGF